MRGCALRACIICHWDTDGICSAAVLKHLLSTLGVETKVHIPEIGKYKISESDIVKIRELEPNIVYVLDYAVPPGDLDLIVKGVGAATVAIDHHAQSSAPKLAKYINPSLKGLRYPSTTWVLKSLLKLETTLPIALGVLGDVGPNVRRLGVYSEVEACLKRLGISIGEAFEMCRLLDTSYKFMDRDGVASAVEYVAKNMENPRALLLNSVWRERLKVLEREVENIVAQAREYCKCVMVAEFSTRHMIISDVARKIAWDMKKVAVAVNRGYGGGLVQVYFRDGIGGLDLTWIIEYAKSLGYSAGGKPEVAGVILPENDLRKFLSFVLERLCKVVGELCRERSC